MHFIIISDKNLQLSAQGFKKIFRVLGARCGVVGVCVFVHMPGVYVCCFLVSVVSLFRLAVRIHVCFVVCVAHMPMWVCSFLCS